MPSENGWEPSRASASQCEWTRIPGAEHVSLQMLKGPSFPIMKAFAADYHAHIEPLRDSDSASYTPTNSVATSNHLNGTAFDLNWNSHPFRVKGTFTSEQMHEIRELQKFYTHDGLLLMFWAGDWQSPIDEMHWQMGYGTFGDSKLQDFTNKKIRPDGFSTYRRGGDTIPAPIPIPEPSLSRADSYALRIINEGNRIGIAPRGIKIALATALVESNLTVYANEKLPKSLALPHDAVGRDGLSVGIFQQQVKDTGNGWWWGDEETCMGVESSAALFYDRLSKIDYNGPNSPGSYAQAIQRSAYPSRYDERYEEASKLYNRLAPKTPAPGPVATPPPSEDFMSALSAQEQRALYNEIMKQRTSKSPLRREGENFLGNAQDVQGNVDGSVHVLVVDLLARLGDPNTLALLNTVANISDPTRKNGSNLAKAILENARRLSSSQATPAPPPAPQQSYPLPQAPAPAPVPVPTPPAASRVSQPPPTTGEGLYSEVNNFRILLREVTESISESVKGE